MCQKCFNASNASPSSSPMATAFAPSARPSIMKFSSESSPRSISFNSLEVRSDAAAPTVATTATTTSSSRRLAFDRLETSTAPAAKKKSVSRCFDCGKRVGLTGFLSRCSKLFYANHWYSHRHDCNYSYKAVGREAIARENPVVKAAKIVKVRFFPRIDNLKTIS